MELDALTETYSLHATREGNSSVFGHAVAAYLHGQLEDELLWDCLTSLQKDPEATSIASWLERARSCAVLAGLSQARKLPERFNLSLGQILKDLIVKSYWKQFQLGDVLIALSSEWLNLPYDRAAIQQLPTGVAPLEWGGHWPAAQLPHQQLHAELGIWWAVLGHVAADKSLVDAAVHLADWQQNLLDSGSLPLPGLYSREQDGSPDQLLVTLSLLYRVAGDLSGRKDLAAHSAKQRQEIAGRSPKVCFATAFVAHWMSQELECSSPEALALSPVICDPHAALVGCRGQDLCAVATLCGANSGLGCLRSGAVNVIAYGPQKLPLGDCGHFGIQRPLPNGRTAGTDISLRAEQDQFDIRGRVQISSANNEFQTSAAEAWMDVRQEFQAGRLSIQTKFFPILAPDQFAFSFFVDAEHCTVDDNECIRALSLDRYAGPVKSVRLDAKQNRLTLTPLSAKGELQVIPLAGAPNFWGARFLIAYVLDPRHTSYAWQLS